MSTSVALSSAAIASSAAANAAARQARKTACVSIETTYRPEMATVQEKQAYAECVDLLYPQPSVPFTGTELLIAKSGVLLLLISMVVGAWWGWREEREIGLAALSCVMAPIVLGCVVFILGLVIAGIAYLFT